MPSPISEEQWHDSRRRDGMLTKNKYGECRNARILWLVESELGGIAKSVKNSACERMESLGIVRRYKETTELKEDFVRKDIEIIL